jgi:hypothetical protein
VSAPSKVVKSTIRIAKSIAQFLLEVLMLRVASISTRALAPTSSTADRLFRNFFSEASLLSASSVEFTPQI